MELPGTRKIIHEEIVMTLKSLALRLDKLADLRQQSAGAPTPAQAGKASGVVPATLPAGSSIAGDVQLILDISQIIKTVVEDLSKLI